MLKRQIKKLLVALGANSLLLRFLGVPLVLGYHRVSDDTSPLMAQRVGCVTPAQFREHIGYFLGIGCKFGPLSEVLTTTTRCSLALTFDDGFRDLYDEAFPVLRGNAIPFTLFLITSLPDSSVLLWQHDLYDVLESLPSGMRASRLGEAMAAVTGRVPEDDTLNQMLNELFSGYSKAEMYSVISTLKSSGYVANYKPEEIYLSSLQIIEMMKNGLTVEAHGHDHWILASLDDEALKREVTRCSEVLRESFAATSNIYAVAHGKASDANLQRIRSLGFDHIVDGSSGALRVGDGFTAPRIWPQGDAVDVSWLLTRTLLRHLISVAGNKYASSRTGGKR